MLNQNDKFERFADVIRKNAQEKCKKIDEQMLVIQGQEIEKLKKQINDEYQDKLDYELEKMRAKTNHDFSEKNSVCKKYLINYRDELTEKVFDMAKVKIIDFAKSEKYSDFIAKSLAVLEENLAQDFVAYVQERDLKLVEGMKKDFALLKDVKISDEITIGGIIAKNESETVVINDTLEARMFAQRDWFMSVSDLSIS